MQFDVIVVGGGTAGAVMAARLSEDEHINVLLIEAGPSDHHGLTKIPALGSVALNSTSFDWRYYAEPDPSVGGRADLWPAGKCLGGGSAINGMNFVRGHRVDYDRWAQEGAQGWDYKNVLPYFRKIERNERGADDYRGGDGPVWVSESRAQSPLTDAWIDAALEFGAARSPDLNGAKAEGVDFVQVSQKNGVRHSTAAAYLDPAMKRKNLTVVTDAQVTRIRFDGRRAVGVDYRQHGADFSYQAGRGVVLCAGALNTPRLLMVSGIGPAQHLQDMGIEPIQDLPGVGCNLQDHPGAQLVYDVNAQTLSSDAQRLGGLVEALKFALARKGLLTASLGNAQAFLRTRDALQAPNVQIVFAALALDIDAEGGMHMRKQPSIGCFASVCRPKSRGTIALRSNDPLAPPVINHQLLSDEDDLEQLVEGVLASREIAGRPSIAKYITGEVRPGSPISNRDGLRGYLKKAAAPSYHFAGTARIGADALAVVDSHLRVRGAEGLWIADASVIPSLPQGGIAATTIMIGERGAALVAAALKSAVAG